MTANASIQARGLGGRSWRHLGAAVWRGVHRHDLTGMAAAVAYHSIFSFFAGFFFLACVATQFGRSQENLEWILAVLRNVLPPPGIRLAEENLARFLRPVSKEALPLALILSLWTASNVVEVVMRGLNRIYSVTETRPWWQTRIGAIVLTAMASFFFIVAFNLTIFERQTVAGLDKLLHYRTILPELLHALQWPLIWLGSVGAAAVIYFLAPNFSRTQRRIALPGAVFFAVVWFILNQGFTGYLANFGDFDRIYGPLGTAMAVLLWVYLSSLILLIGGEINAEVGRVLPRKSKKPVPTTAEAA